MLLRVIEMMQRFATVTVGLVWIVGITGWMAASMNASDPIRETVLVTGGEVDGAASADGVVLSFKGIPFAAPPVGELRWRPPQPVEPWDGIRSAETFGSSCVQNLARSRPPWTEAFMVQGEAGEDCLYLNVWTAAEDTDEGRPVLVYIHGGGFNEGSGSVAVYDGEALARKGPVVVTINYRLGPLGFLAHPELTEESPVRASGNYGMLDQVAALEWVRENIGAFGGDPSRVTIAGQSAGAMAVVLLTASPLAEDLFHRAIVQSGPGALTSFGVASYEGLAGTLAAAEEAGVQFAEARGAESLDALRSLSPEEIMSTLEGSAGQSFGPVVDGWFLTDAVDEVYERGEMHDVPTISGMNADEPSAFPGYGEMMQADIRELAEERYGERAAEYMDLYGVDSDETAGAAAIATSRDRALVAMRRLAEARAERADTDLYMYYFGRGIPWPEYPDFGAFHTAEVPYVFDNLDKLDRPWDSVDRRLADWMSSYWARFAATGDPNDDGLPTWDPYDVGAGSFMVFDQQPSMRFLPRPDRERFLESTASPGGR